MKRAGDALTPIVRELGLEDALRLHRIKKCWRNALGHPLCLHMSPSALNKGQLVINVDTPAWLQQAGYFRAQILDKLGYLGVSGIRLRLGAVAAPAPPCSGPQAPRAEPDQKVLDEVVAGITDDDLRESIRRAVRKGLGTAGKAKRG